jgi:hypothetical protein
MSIAVPVAALIGFCSPFDYNVWDCGIVTKSMIQVAVDNQLFLDHEQWEQVKQAAEFGLPTATEHAQRVAYLVGAGWTQPIEVDVGVPGVGAYGTWIYEDGNHRLCAAVMRNDASIEVNFGGDLDYAESIFGIKID